MKKSFNFLSLKERVSWGSFETTSLPPSGRGKVCVDATYETVDMMLLLL